MLDVYLDPCTVNSRKVLAGLHLLDTKYNFNHVNYFTGEHKGPEYLKINPMVCARAAVLGSSDLNTPARALFHRPEMETAQSPNPMQSCSMQLMSEIARPIQKT